MPHTADPPFSSCRPDFDSPSIFCRLLDKDKGGYFSISPPGELHCTTKQQYLPSSCILQTRYIHEDGVVDLVDFFPRPKSARVMTRGGHGQGSYREATQVQEELKKWLVRRVECMRGALTLDVEIFPAFDYARKSHETTLLRDRHAADAAGSKVATFRSGDEGLQLDVAIEQGGEEEQENDATGDANVTSSSKGAEGGCGGGGDGDGAKRSNCPAIVFKKVRKPGLLGEGLVARIRMREGQTVSFVLRRDAADHVTREITSLVLDSQQHDTQRFWFDFVSQSKYKGRWMEVVTRSLMILKMLTYG